MACIRSSPDPSLLLRKQIDVQYTTFDKYVRYVCEQNVAYGFEIRGCEAINFSSGKDAIDLVD